LYDTATSARYTVTVRDSAGTASGWAGVDHSDWTRIDAVALSQRALEKCLTSLNPVTIEPGRYTVVLEPQAVHDLIRVALQKEIFVRLDNEKYDSLPYNLRRAPRHGLGVAKFGIQVVDARISIGTDPGDPNAGYIPFDADGEVYTSVTWVQQGVLQNLPYDLDYALEILNSGMSHPYTGAYRMTGGETSLDAMVNATERGIYVTRFVQVDLLHQRSVLATGTTADGTWLIERGRRSRPIKNLRFTMSPLFAFNQVEALGRPERVYAPDAPALVPPAQLRDFFFSAATDAL
jgi:predicted Zn-dependent protease